jgi:hypothetical protein
MAGRMAAKRCKKPSAFEHFQKLRFRKAQMNYIVGIILLLIAFFVIWGITGKIITIMKESGDTTACTASAQLSSKTKIAGVETISLRCPMKLVDITADDLSAGVGKAEAALNKIRQHNEENKDNPSKQIKLDKFLNPGSEKEFVLDTKVAEEMKQCWTKLGEGELDLFNAWYTPVALKAMPWIGMKILPTLKTPPVTCVICARIKFDSEIQKDYADVKSLDEWLKINTVPNKGITYYDFLLDELHDQYLFTPIWEFKTEEPIAVVFARMSPQYSVGKLQEGLGKIGITALGKAQDAVDVLYLIKYSEVKNYCNYLANEAPKEE